MTREEALQVQQEGRKLGISVAVEEKRRQAGKTLAVRFSCPLSGKVREYVSLSGWLVHGAELRQRSLRAGARDTEILLRREDRKNEKRKAVG